MSEFFEVTETLIPEPALALGALLDVPVPNLEHGAGLPLLWHWVYLLDRPAQADLGPDGHPVRGAIVVPPGPGRRRMWAGGRVRSNGLLRCGETATRRSRVLSVRDKQGRSGHLTFVVVGHQILQRGHIVVDEQQDIVYRDGPSSALPACPPAAYGNPDGATVPAAAAEWAIAITPALLFRFSALTYNAHRVHYDRDYARDIEGYPGLLTHGPLQAIGMAEAARRAGHPGQDFQYRLTSPLFDYQGMVVGVVHDKTAIVTSVRDIYGRQTATGILHSSDL